MGLQDILKVLVGMLLVVRVFCCTEYRNWQSLVCNEALSGGVVWVNTWGGGTMILQKYMIVHLYIGRRMLKLNI